MAGNRCAYRHRMRCSTCRLRFAIRRHPDEYIRKPKCPHCNSPSIFSIEAQRARQAAKEKRCYCNSYPFPHRAGTLRACTEHPANADGIDLNAEELEAYKQIINTPRSC